MVIAHKIINGKRYNTKTAKKVACYSNGYPYTDFGYFCETLYRKKTGEFFLHKDGGAFTRYAHTYKDGSVSGGEKIIPLSAEEAKKWLKENPDVYEYVKVFDEIKE